MSNSTGLDLPTTSYDDFSVDCEITQVLPEPLKNYVLYGSPYPISALAILECLNEYRKEVSEEEAIERTLEEVKNVIRDALIEEGVPLGDSIL